MLSPLIFYVCMGVCECACACGMPLCIRVYECVCANENERKKTTTMLWRWWWRWRQVTLRAIWRWRWSEVKRYRAKKNAHNHIYDEQRNGSKGKYYLLFLSTYNNNNILILLGVYVRISFVFLLHLSLRFIYFFCLRYSYFVVVVLWFSKLLVSVFSNDRLCCVLDSFSSFHFVLVSFFSRLLLFLFYFSCILSVSYKLLVRTKFVRVCFVHCFFLSLCSFRLRFHFVLNVFVYALKSELKASREQRLYRSKHQANKQQEYIYILFEPRADSNGELRKMCICLRKRAK